MVKQMIKQHFQAESDLCGVPAIDHIRIPSYEVMYPSPVVFEAMECEVKPMPKINDFLKEAVLQIIDNCRRNNI